MAQAKKASKATPLYERAPVLKRRCIVDGTKFETPYARKVYCSNDWPDSCWATLIRAERDAQPIFLRVVNEQDYLCWQCKQPVEKLIIVILRPDKLGQEDAPLELGDIRAGCLPCKTALYRGLAEIGTTK